MVEKTPRPIPAFTERFDLVKTRINVQKGVKNYTEEQADKICATHTRTEIAGILDVLKEEGLSLPPCKKIHESRDPNFYIWYKVYWDLGNNNLIRTVERLGEKAEEVTVVAENRPEDWIEYDSRMIDELNKIEANSIQQNIGNMLAGFKKRGIELPDHLNYVELESSTDNQKNEIIKLKHLGDTNRLVKTRQSIDSSGNITGEESITNIFHPDVHPGKWIESESKIKQKYNENAQEVEKNKSASK
jgi:hypothetical protein